MDDRLVVYTNGVLPLGSADILNARDEAVDAANEAESSASSAEQSAVEAAESAAVGYEALGLADTVFQSISDAMSKSYPSDVSRVEIVGESTSNYVRADNEPAHSAKFQDASGQWWEKQNSYSVSALEFSENGGGDVDHHEALQAALEFMLISQTNVGQELDLCGLTWGVSAPLIVPSKVKIKNGALKAIGTLADWSNGSGEQEAVIKCRPGSSRVHLDRVEIDCNRIANGLNENGSSSSRISFSYVGNYVEYGLRYTGGGCYWTNFIVQKFGQGAGQMPERTRKSARTGYGIDIQGVDGRISSGAVAGKIRTSPSCHHMTITQLHGWDSTGVNTNFTGTVGSGSFTMTWQVDSVEDIRVRKNGSVLTPDVDYTVSLSGDFFPTIDIDGLISSDNVTVYNCNKDYTSWEIRGYACAFSACYIDNGYVDIYNMDNHFDGIGLYLSDYTNLSSHVRLWARSENDYLGNLVWNVRRASSSLQVFKLMAEEGRSWAYGSSVVEDYSMVDFSISDRLTIRGNTTSSVVHAIASAASSGRALTRFRGAGTTGIVASGAEVDDYIIMTNGSVRFRVGADGESHAGVFRHSGNIYSASNATPTIDSIGRLVLPVVYTKSTLLAPSQVPRRICYISDPDTGKPHVVYSTGLAWMYMDGSPV